MAKSYKCWKEQVYVTGHVNNKYSHELHQTKINSVHLIYILKLRQLFLEATWNKIIIVPRRIPGINVIRL